MKKVSSALIIGVVASIILGFGVVAGVAYGLQKDHTTGYEPDVLKAVVDSAANGSALGAAHLDLSVYPDSGVCHPNDPQPESGWVTYCPSTQWQVPAHSVITVTVKQYDSSTGVLNDFFSQVQGTVGGTATYSGATGSTGQTKYNSAVLQGVDAANIAHTLTIQSRPFDSDPKPLFVSVPLIGVPGNANVTDTGTPDIISFQFITDDAGHVYIWHCYVPCGNPRGAPYGFAGPMSTTGFMAGTVTVI